PLAFKEEILLTDAIAANVSRAEKKKKCRVVYRTHGVGSTHHARSDDVPVSVPTIVRKRIHVVLLANPDLAVALHHCIQRPLQRCDTQALIPSPKLRFTLFMSPLDCRLSSGISARKSARTCSFTDILGRGKDFSADLERNLFKLANFPLSLWTSLIFCGDDSCNTAIVLSGDDFIHSGFCVTLNNQVVNVYFYVPTNLAVKSVVHQPLTTSLRLPLPDQGSPDVGPL
nr:hypothetical protein [Tanacetum cinerariifolium]